MYATGIPNQWCLERSVRVFTDSMDIVDGFAKGRKPECYDDALAIRKGKVYQACDLLERRGKRRTIVQR